MGRMSDAVCRVLAGGRVDTVTLEEARRDALVVVNDPWRQYSSFFWRLALAAVVATGGIAAASTAVVIGAMLIAPLMSPMLGCALAIVSGRPRAAVRTLLVTVTGVALCIVIAAAVGAVAPVSVNTATNQEVLARVTPRLIDLVVALASGMMAALALVRDDIPDAVPGIAISASLVPPLCVVGVALQAGDVAAARGSMLLFIANFFAIQLMCCAVFAALGLGRRVRSERAGRMRAAWYVLTAAGALVVAVPLAVTSWSIIEVSARERAAAEITVAWLEESEYRLREFDMEDGVLSIEIAGVGRAPSPARLAEELDEAQVGVEELRVVPVAERRVPVS